MLAACVPANPPKVRRGPSAWVYGPGCSTLLRGVTPLTHSSLNTKDRLDTLTLSIRTTPAAFPLSSPSYSTLSLVVSYYTLPNAAINSPSTPHNPIVSLALPSLSVSQLLHVLARRAHAADRRGRRDRHCDPSASHAHRCRQRGERRLVIDDTTCSGPPAWETAKQERPIGSRVVQRQLGLASQRVCKGSQRSCPSCL